MNTLTAIPLPLQTLLLLLASNLFMTFAWYGHLKNLSAAPGMPQLWRVGVLPCLSTSCRYRPTELAFNRPD